MAKFSERVKSLRDESGMTQEMLCDKTGLTMTTISRYENGKRTNPGKKELKKLAEVFNVSIDYLVGDSDVRESLGIKEIENLYIYLNESNKQKALSYLKYLLGEQNNG